MAATFRREDAKIERIYIRRVLPGGNQVYELKPFLQIKYDDGTAGLEPANASPYLSNMTTTDAEEPGVIVEQLIVDHLPYNDIHEFH